MLTCEPVSLRLKCVWCVSENDPPRGRLSVLGWLFVARVMCVHILQLLKSKNIDFLSSLIQIQSRQTYKLKILLSANSKLRPMEYYVF